MDSARVVLIRIINIIGFILEAFLLGRILLRLVGANPATPFVSWVYSISGTLVYPFKGIFADLTLANGSVLDMSALVSFIAYALIISLIVAIINAIITPMFIHRGHVHTEI